MTTTATDAITNRISILSLDHVDIKAIQKKFLFINSSYNIGLQS